MDNQELSNPVNIVLPPAGVIGFPDRSADFDVLPGFKNPPRCESFEQSSYRPRVRNGADQEPREKRCYCVPFSGIAGPGPMWGMAGTGLIDADQAPGFLFVSVFR